MTFFRRSLSSSSLQARVLFLCFVTYSLVYTGRLNLSIASPLLQEGGILTTEQIGILASVFFFVYALGRVVNGRLGDRLPPKPYLTGGLLLSGLCNLGLALLPSSGLMYCLWGLNGFFQSMLWGAALCNVSSAYPDGVMAKRSAVILSASVGVGTLLGIALPTLLVPLGVRALFLIPGALLVCLSLLLAVLLPSGKAKSKNSTRPALACLKNPLLRSMLFPAIAHGAIKENITLWVPLLFLELYGLDLQKASFYIFLMPLATLAGRLLFPFWRRMCRGQEKWILLSSFILCVLALLPFLFCRPPVWLSGCLLALVSMATSFINAELISVYPVSFQKTNEVSTVSGLLDCASYIGSALGSAFFGFLILSWGYSSMIAVWGALSLLSALLLLLPGSHRRDAQ